MDLEPASDGEAPDAAPSDDVTPRASERSTVAVEKSTQRVAGDKVAGFGFLVVGAPVSRVNATCEGFEVEIKQYQPGGRTDLDETQVIVHDIYDGDVVEVNLEVTDG